MDSIDLPRIIDAAVKTIRRVQLDIKDHLRWHTGALKPTTAPHTGKPALLIDVAAELRANTLLLQKLGLDDDQLNYLGEEQLGRDRNAEKIDLSTERRLCVLVDMIDG